jgi:hypothetical protein
VGAAELARGVAKDGLDDDGTNFTAFFAEGVSAGNPTDVFYAEVSE